MHKIILSEKDTLNTLAVLNRKSSDHKIVRLVLRKRKYQLAKGDEIQLFYHSLNNKLRLLSTVKCKSVVANVNGTQTVTLRTTYERKYYLNKKVKQAGFQLKLELTAKTILVPPDHVHTALHHPAVQELSNCFNYGIQYTIL